MATEKNDGGHCLGRIAWLYYEQGMNQQEIADYIGVSRLTVNRALKEAREGGVVEIRVNEKYIRGFALEEELCRATGLKAATVIPSAPDIIAALGSGAVPRFKEAMASSKTIALGGGRTIMAMVRRLPRLRKFATEQMVSMGEFLSADALYEPETAAHLITTRLGVKCHRIESYPLDTPLEALSAIKDSPSRARAIQLARDADIAFTSACDVSTSDTIYYNPMTAEIRAELLRHGVVGEIEGTLYTLDGKAHETAFSRRECVTLPMKCPVVLVSGGLNKVNAIVGAIRGGFVDELITDGKAAAKIIAFF